MKNDELIELIEDLQKALSKALNNEVIRELDHLQVRAEIAVKKLTSRNMTDNYKQTKYYETTKTKD